MKKKIIENYVLKLNKEHIVKFARDNNISLNNSEIELVYNEIKENWAQYLYGNPDFEKIRKFEDGENIIRLFNLYKEKYKNYL